MDNDTWTRASALFDELYELPEADRISYLKKLAQTDPALYRRLTEIMRFEKAGGSFLGDEALSRYGDFIGDLVGQLDDPVPMEGRLIGSYRIIRQAGYGGMGAVYLAERSDGAFDRRVALKFIRTELQQTTLIERFKREQRIQASLQHEAIPRLYDAGTDEHGTPYIVMDYVEGEPVTEYVRREQLPPAKILDLFARICDVIHFAHQNLIIHRDLKPSNIYITPDGDIKLLDFGIATLADPDSGEGHVRTGLNFFSLTYASPEQISGRPVTTATDTYALGVLLYVLLSGKVPYTTEDKTPAAIQQVICEDPVVPPSRKVDEENTGEVVGGEPIRRFAVTARQLRGDLDTIVLKALEKEPSRRYLSVQAMADDIRRYLNNEPIQARPPGYLYTLGKFLRRNAAAAGTAALVFLMLLSGFIYHSVTVSAERDIARNEAAKFEQMAGFLVDLLDYDEMAVPPEEATVANLLQAGTLKLSTGLQDNPEVRAELLLAVGRSFLSLGDNQQALDMISEGVAIMQERGGGYALTLGEALTELAEVQHHTGNPASLETIDEALLLTEQEHGRVSEPHARALHRKGWYLYRLEEGNEENRDRAALYFAAYLGIMHSLFDYSDEQYALALIEYASLKADYADRMALYEVAKGLVEAREGRYHYRVANIYDSMALDTRFEDPELSISYFREAMEIYTSLYGDNHYRTINTQTNMSSALRRAGRNEEAIEVLQRSVDGAKRLYQPGSVRIADQQFWLANAWMVAGDLEKSGRLFGEALRVYDVNYEPGSQKPELARTLAGQIMMNTGRPDEGRAMIEQSIANTIALHGEDHSMVSFSRGRLPD